MPTKSITFHCEIITPMFIGNAIPGKAELRPTAIKGALRFWWRAMHGDIPIDDKKDNNGNIKGLRTQEAEIFGSADEKIGRSKVVIEILEHPKPERIKTGLPLDHQFNTIMYGGTARGNRGDVDIIKFLAYGSEDKEYFDIHEISYPSTFTFKLEFSDSTLESSLKDAGHYYTAYYKPRISF